MKSTIDMTVHVSIPLILSCIVVFKCFFLASILLFLYSPTWADHLHLQEYFSGTLQNSLYNIFRMPAPSTSFQIRYCASEEVIISLTVFTLQFF